jgi:hypothetical protein
MATVIDLLTYEAPQNHPHPHRSRDNSAVGVLSGNAAVARTIHHPAVLLVCPKRPGAAQVSRKRRVHRPQCQYRGDDIVIIGRHLTEQGRSIICALMSGQEKFCRESLSKVRLRVHLMGPYMDKARPMMVSVASYERKLTTCFHLTISFILFIYYAILSAVKSTNLTGLYYYHYGRRSGLHQLPVSYVR